MNNKIQVAIITGGHSFDVLHFHRLFWNFNSIEPYIQHLDDYICSSKELRESYDVLLFFFMMQDGPSDEGHPLYVGKPRTVLSQLGNIKQGIFLMHHSILAYPDWPLWDEIVGIKDRMKGFSYHQDESFRVHVLSTKHPISEKISDWNMVDELYHMVNPGKDSTVLLTVDHPKSMKNIAWTRLYKYSRVFCFQSGHNKTAWENESFRRVLIDGIKWCAR